MTTAAEKVTVIEPMVAPNSGGAGATNTTATNAADSGTASNAAAGVGQPEARGPQSGPSGVSTQGTTLTASAAPDKRRALGRGLDSLLPGPRIIPTAPAANPGGGATSGTAGSGAIGSGVAGPGAPGFGAESPAGAGLSTGGADLGAPQPAVIPDLQGVAAQRPEGTSVIMLSLDRVDANPYQTRYKFREEDLQDLASSITVSGVLQPIVVRPGRDGHYVLIVGERRMRASRMAGKTTIPALIRHVSEQQAAEMTVTENLQRQDLNPLEQAFAFARLSKEFKLTQEQIGQGVGISRESVSNYMRLLKLPEKVQEYIGHGTLGFSEARVLLTLDDAPTIEKIAAQAVKEGLSVDALEVLVLRARGLLETPDTPKTGGARWVDPNVRQAQRELERVLGCRVRIRDRNGKGKITIEYSRLEDFDRVMELFKKK
jgi:ParB family transcriptional regulator, chromosome partitioning protein